MDPRAGQGMEQRNDEAREALPDISGIPVILNHILEQLPNSELLQASLVSQLWKKQARIVMQKRGNVMALLDDNRFTGCGKVFQAFAANLETLNESLYSGMTIKFSSMNQCQGTGALEVEAIHASILAGMKGKLKRLSIRLKNPEDCCNARDCPSFLLLRLLLRDFIGDLEHLRLKIEDIMVPFIQQYLPHGPYPNLKVLKLDDGYDSTTDEETFGNQIRTLVSRAPNLQEIHTRGCLNLRENLMEGREGVVHVHKPFDFVRVKNISESVIPTLRLKAMHFFYTYKPELNLDRFNEKAQRLLETCCATTLEILGLTSVVSGVVLFMSYGIRLLNVDYITIDSFDYVELEQLDPRIKSIMMRFDFTHFLPKLTHVHITYGGCFFAELSPGEVAAIIEQANNAVRKEPTLPRNGNITYLDLEQSSIPVAAVEFFSQMFPAIEKLRVDPGDTAFPFESAWVHWPELKLIEVDGKQCQRP